MTGRFMNDSPALQLILPTDKRNPCFSLYLDEAEQEIHVYYGLELLEIVPNESEHSAYKLRVLAGAPLGRMRGARNEHGLRAL